MKTDSYFAPPTRANAAKLSAQAELVVDSTVVSGLLRAVSGLLAVLNEQRQVVALNDELLEYLGIADQRSALGLRPGEALACTHSDEMPAGCGTSMYCETCGMAVAIVASLGMDRPVERLCALRARRGDAEVDVALRIRSQPLDVKNERFLLLYVQDVTREEQRAALERAFFHDVNNIITVLIGASDLLVESHPTQESRHVLEISARLNREVQIQRALLASEASAYQPSWECIGPQRLLEQIEDLIRSHPAARGRRLEVVPSEDMGPITTDTSLLMRLLCNMIVNALEATDNGGVVKVWADCDEARGRVCFRAWNDAEISSSIARRIFQRSYSTKEGSGRGIGTWSMKYFGERVLGGDVHFTTSSDGGTVFTIEVPIEQTAAE